MKADYAYNLRQNLVFFSCISIFFMYNIRYERNKNKY